MDVPTPDQPDEPESMDSERADVPQPESDYPVDRLRARLRGALGDRPLGVYLVLLAGAATLIILLIVVWVTATGGGGDNRPICTDIAAVDAKNAVLAGDVKRIDVLVNDEKPEQSLTGVRFEFNDGTCRQSPQGADVRDDLYLILGAVDFYNNFASDRVRVHYQRQPIQAELLYTSTPTPSETPVPPTAPSSPVADSTTLPTEAATIAPTLPPPSPSPSPLPTVVPVTPTTTSPSPAVTSPTATRTPTRTP